MDLGMIELTDETLDEQTLRDILQAHGIAPDDPAIDDTDAAEPTGDA